MSLYILVALVAGRLLLGGNRHLVESALPLVSRMSVHLAGIEAV